MLPCRTQWPSEKELETLDSKFSPCRMEVPNFYTIDPSYESQILPRDHWEGKVFAKSSSHFMRHYSTLGYVSRQSPLGQGTYMGFPTRVLRPASPVEVAMALGKTHPHGDGFSPARAPLKMSDFDYNEMTFWWKEITDRQIQEVVKSLMGEK
jgi:hypothetical protein